jgi:hypothetical protein
MKKIVLGIYFLINIVWGVYAQPKHTHFISNAGKAGTPKTAATSNFLQNGGSGVIKIENQIFDFATLNQSNKAIDIQNRTNNNDSIIIRGCIFKNYKGTVFSISIYLFNVRNVIIENCWFENTCLGVLISGSANVASIRIENNKFKDIDQTPPSAGSSAIQLVGVSGTNINILNNRVQNFSATSIPGDCISLINTKGTAASYVNVTGNWVKTSPTARIVTNYTGACLVLEGTAGTKYINVKGCRFDGGQSWNVQVIQNVDSVNWGGAGDTDMNIFFCPQKNSALLGYSSGAWQFEPQAGNNRHIFENNKILGVYNDGTLQDMFGPLWYNPPSLTFLSSQIEFRPLFLQNLIINNQQLLPDNILTN